MEKKQHEPDHNLFPADYELLAEAFTIKKTPRIWKASMDTKQELEKRGQQTTLFSGCSSCFSGLEKPVESLKWQG